MGGGFALGAKLCRPDSDIWIIYGDGSLGYSVAEFDTFTRHKVFFYSDTHPFFFSCTPDRNCHTFCLGDKIASHPGVLTQAKKNTQNLEINQILGVVVQEKESNMVFCSRWKFPTLGMTVLSRTSAEPRFRSARSSLGLETSI